MLILFPKGSVLIKPMTEHKEKQIKTKTRVAAFGEVFTAEREVQAMLDLVKDEAERLESRFLEPACGDGNFLCAILKRKLSTLKNRYKAKKEDFEVNLLITLGSIYAIDLLADNIETARSRLFDLALNAYKNTFRTLPDATYQKIMCFVLEKNILQGDSLNGIDKIVFTQWSALGYQIKREEYSFKQMNSEGDIAALPLFSVALDENNHPVFFPKPLKVYPFTYYKNLLEIE